ncbi:MAG: hypothetical protein EOP47_11305, partial [Sphingobacteriaceae bacterium]
MEREWRDRIRQCIILGKRRGVAAHQNQSYSMASEYVSIEERVGEVAVKGSKSVLGGVKFIVKFLLVFVVLLGLFVGVAWLFPIEGITKWLMDVIKDDYQ